MSSGISRAYRALALDFLTGRATINAGAILTPYIELSNTPFDELGAGGTPPAPNQWDTYHRAAIGPMNASVNGVATNSAAISFPVPVISSGFTAAYWGLYDASNGGTLIAFGAFTPGTTIGAGTTFQIPANGLVLTIPATSIVTNYGANRVLDVLTGKAASSTNFTATYAALYTTRPGSDGTGVAALNELSYSGYARVALSSANLAAATLAATTQALTGANLTFPIETSGGSSAAITGWAIVDTVAGIGNILLTQAVTGAPTISANTFPNIASGTVLAALTAP